MSSPNSDPVYLDSLDPEARAVVEKFLAADPVRRRPPPKVVWRRPKPPRGVPQAPRRYRDADAAREAWKAGYEVHERRWDEKRRVREMQRRADQGLPPLEDQP